MSDDKELLWKRIQHQQEARDRWFRYSLILLGVPLGIVAAFEKAELTDRNLVGAGALIFFFIGVCFLMLHVLQRSNSVELTRRLDLKYPTSDIKLVSTSDRILLRGQYGVPTFTLTVPRLS